MLVQRYPFLANLPIISTVLFFCILAFCVLYASFGPTEYGYGGIRYPYISDTIKHDPTYTFYLVSMSIVTIIVFVGSTCYAQLLNCEGKRVSAAFIIVLNVLAMLSALLLGGFDTNDYPTLHDIFATLFFVFILIWTIVVTWNVYRLAQPRFNATYQSIWYRVRIPKYSCIVFIVVGLIIYLPVGISLSCEVERDENNEPDYTGCSGVNEMRAITQQITVFFLIVFQATTSMELRAVAGISRHAKSKNVPGGEPV
eukprot:Clim_evm45s148 gene=Clim_evmTU45s148